MLSLSLVTLGLATIGAYAKPTVRAVGGLEVSLSTPTDKVASVSDFRIVATVKNVGDEDLKILKSGTVLDNEIPTRSFIVNKDDKETPFTGVTLYFSTDNLSENNWVVIPAGKTVTAEHNVSDVYDFSASGPGTFTFDPISRFHVIGPNNTVQPISDVARMNVVNAGSVSITITDVPTTVPEVSKHKLKLGKRSNIVCSDPKKAAFIRESLDDARYLNMIASTYISSRGNKDPVYKDYFGDNPTSSVISVLNAIYADNTNWTLDCSDPYDLCKQGPQAYASRDRRGIFYCDGFYKTHSPDAICKGRTKVDGRYLRGGITIHEFTHAIRYTEDYTQNCPDARKPIDYKKIRSAANFDCFVAQAYKNSRCP